ncbi:MAG: hypothetical protein JNK00_04155 [Flavipsychrobacter sp.]|nr:hypothetical protein [Flavipsychrobacter sp.]
MSPCNKKNDTITFQHYLSCATLPDDWDRLLPEGHFLKRNNLQATQQSSLPHLSYVYVLVSKGTDAIAAIYFQVLKLQRHHLNEGPLSTVQKLGWQAFTNIVNPRLLVAGHLFRHDVETCYYNDTLSHFEAYKIYNDVINEQLRATCSYAVLVKDLPDELVTYFQHYAQQYIMLRNDIMMELDIPAEWDNIHDYEKALKHKYAQRFRKVRAALNGIEVAELDAIQTEAEKKNIYALYRQVCEKQTARIGIISEDFLPALKKYNPESLKVWAIRENGKIVAFFSAWVKEDAFDMFYIGFDYSRNNDLMLYFNILFCGVEQAIIHKKTKAIFGRTALDAKARLGCKPVYKSTFVMVRNKFIRMATLRLQNNSQSQEGEWEQRHPLKNK